jgi:uncharacterized membrane protein YfcA
MSSPSALFAVAAVLACAFAVETALGFGASLITVALAGLVVDDLRELLAMIVPLNVLLSIYLVGRYRRDVDRDFLLRRLLPLMALGMPLGWLVVQGADANLLRRLFGAFVVVVAGLELYRMGKHQAAVALREPVRVALLVLGGAVHGAFSTGGPMAVYVTGRSIEDKSRYRATLSSLWLVLGIALLGFYFSTGHLSMETLRRTALVSPGVVVGMVIGELLFRRVPAEAFRRVVFATLVLSGVALAVRS